MIFEFCTYLLNNDVKNAELLFKQSADDLKVIENLIVPAMTRIGELWEQQDISLSQIYLSSRIVERLVKSILPAESSSRKYDPRIAIASLEDYHLMGKNIVLSIVMSSGYAIKDFGRVAADELETALLKENYDILLISTLMLPSALQVKAITDFIKTHQLKTTVAVGGAPFNFDKELAGRVGADFYCEKAQDVLKVIAAVKETVR